MLIQLCDLSSGCSFSQVNDLEAKYKSLFPVQTECSMIAAHLSSLRSKIIIQLITSLCDKWSNSSMMLLLPVFLRWFPCHGNWFLLRRDSHAHGSRNQTPAFVLFEALQVDKRTDEGGGGGLVVEGWGCIEEDKQVRHRSLVSAICSRCRQGDKRKKQQREEGSAAGKVICL